MDYLISDRNTLVWFFFTVYALTTIFILPGSINIKSSSLEISQQQALQFASRFVLRIALIFPMIFLLKNIV